MGEEVSDYIDRLVPAMQSAYGVAWNIEARGESPKSTTAHGRSRWVTPISCRSGTGPWAFK